MSGDGRGSNARDGERLSVARYYADVPSRTVALLIDAVLFTIAVVAAIVVSMLIGPAVEFNSAGSALTLVLLRPWRAVFDLTNPSLAARLTGCLEHRRSARIVGLEYLGGTRDEASERALVEAITAGLPGGRDAVRAASSDELRELLAVRVRQDFDAELTVNLRGWIVSRTEARLCALAAVQERTPA